MRAHELMKKARRAKILPKSKLRSSASSKADIGRELFGLAERCQQQGLNAEALLRAEIQKRDRALRKLERQKVKTSQAQ